MQSRSGVRHDLHTHVFSAACHVVENARYAPDHEALPEQLLATAGQEGIRRILLVQPSFLGTDNSFALATAAAAPDTFRCVVVLDDQEPDVSLLENPLVVGVRLNLIGRSAPDFGSPAWKEVGRTLAGRGSHLEIQAATDQWGDVLPAISSWPGLVVIDHLGRPSGGDEALDAVLAQDHVWAKVSGFYRGDPEAVVRRLEWAVGSMADRLVWGSDWPFTQHEATQSYAGVVRRTRELLTPDLWDQITVDNACRLVPWGS